MKFLFKKLCIYLLFCWHSCSNKGVIVYNYLGIISLINKKALKIYNYKNKKELIGHSFLKIIPKENLKNKLILFESVVSEDLIEKKFTKRKRITKNNENIYVLNRLRSFTYLGVYFSIFRKIK